MLLLRFIAALGLAGCLIAGDDPRSLQAHPGKTPTLDGVISPGEWDDATAFWGVEGWKPQFSAVTGTQDLSLKGYVKHDGKRLYFAFDVTDDVLYGIDTPRWLPSNNPKAHYKERVTVADVLASRIICKPLHLLDCCVETDNANAIIVTSAERARNCRQPLVLIRGVVGRCNKPRMDMHYQHGPISTVAGHYAREILWPNSGVGPQDVDVTGSYDAFTFTTMLQLEDYGFCKKGEGGHYVSDGTIRLGGRRPNNTSGGHLCEGYTHGINMVIENVRQLRHDADDSCPVGADGKRRHTYDYREGGCRQAKNVEVTANLGWAMPGTGSAMVMRRG